MGEWIPNKKNILYSSKEDNSLDDIIDNIGKMLIKKEENRAPLKKKATGRDLRNELGLDGATGEVV